MAIYNDASYYYVTIQNRVIFKTTSFIELYHKVTELQKAGKKYAIH